MSDDPRLQAFAKFTPEQELTPGYGDTYLFFVGRDDCHGIVKQLIEREQLMLKFNMFGYDDDELNNAIMAAMLDRNLHVQATLDQSQAGGVHERAIIEHDRKLAGDEFNNSFVIGKSATRQISHTKGGVLVGQGIAFEGSMNWSASGEGIGISLKPGKQPPGWKAQNNTLLVTTNPVVIGRFSYRLDVEHHDALRGAQ